MSTFDYQQYIRENNALYPNLFTDSLAPSAPPLEEKEDCTIQWKVLPKAPEPQWHQVTKTREAIQKWSLRLSFPAAAGTVYTGIWFTATPFVVLGTFSTFGLATLALVATGVALSRIAPSPLDKDNRLKQRQEAE